MNNLPNYDLEIEMRYHPENFDYDDFKPEEQGEEHEEIKEDENENRK